MVHQAEDLSQNKVTVEETRSIQSADAVHSANFSGIADLYFFQSFVVRNKPGSSTSLETTGVAATTS